jgi:hypothetical protein
MSRESLLVDAAVAQDYFEKLPDELRIASLSPEYAVADAARDASLNALFLLWREGTAALLHSVHEASVPGENAYDWRSPYNYGGPLSATGEKTSLEHGWAAFRELANERRVIAEFVRFHPIIANHHLYPGQIYPDRRVVMLDLTVKDLLSSYSGRARTAVRKALNNGLQMDWVRGEFAGGTFPEFYREEMRRIGASDFYLFPDSYFERLLALRCTRVLAVRRDGDLLAMGMFLFGPQVVEYHLSATTPAGRRLGATNLLVHGAAQAAQASGVSQLYLGGGSDKSADNSLLQFKCSFAPAERVFHVGSQVFSERVYASLQARMPTMARNGRVLFYRG